MEILAKSRKTAFMCIMLVVVYASTATVSSWGTCMDNEMLFGQDIVQIDDELLCEEAASVWAGIGDKIVAGIISWIICVSLDAAIKYIKEHSTGKKIGVASNNKTSAQITRVSFQGVTFNPNLTSNWLGDNYDNKTSICKAVQKVMTYELDIACGSIDGIWGTKTKAGVKKMQTRLGVTSDGICGKNTYIAMVPTLVMLPEVMKDRP